MIKYIIFDIGGVIVDFEWKERIEYLAKLGGNRDNEYKKVESVLLGKMELGLINLDTFETEIARLLRIKKSEIEWVKYYSKNAKTNKKMIELIKKLKPRYKIAFLSNVDSAHYSQMRKMFDFGLFDYKIGSCFIHLRKPDPEIFMYTLRKLRIKPREAIFIDNQIENVISARSVGIKSLWFKNAKKLILQLKRLKVL